ncbi:CocE/NonD family hydrolase [Streptomyces sp. URMC 123]|uniref:CocE/NonD family hydrolase n=1 Tax=Streptomyces sp. URMC 123 TaxID=3423403 RepID=UPI003F1B497F
MTERSTTSRHGRLVRTELRVAPGAVLVADHCLPPGPGPFPTVLIRTPYDRRAHHAELRAWARHGFAAVAQDVRGRHGSTGEWSPYAHEAEDGALTLCWLREQPWCDGRIVACGASYAAHCALVPATADPGRGGRSASGEGASRGPDAVIAAVPALGLAETARTRTGVEQLYARAGWWAAHGDRPDSDPEALDRVLRADPDALAHLPVADLPERLALGRPLPGWDRLWRARRVNSRSAAARTAPGASSGATVGTSLVTAGARTAPAPTTDAPAPAPAGQAAGTGAFDPGPARPAPRTVPRPAHGHPAGAVPLLAVGGTHDPFVEETLDLWQYWGGPTRLLLGPWGHGLTADPGHDADRAHHLALGPAYAGFARAALAGELRGRGGAFALGGTGHWLAAEHWGSREPWEVPLLDGPLGVRPLRGAAGFLADPERPVRSDSLHVPAGGEPDRALLVTRPLAAPLDLAGTAEARLRATADAPSADWAVRVVALAPDGRAAPLAVGIARRTARPGASADITVPLGPLARRLAAGTRLRVEIAGHHFPAHARNPHTGEDPVHATVTRPSRRTVRLALSRLRLPVLDPAAVDRAAPPPATARRPAPEPTSVPSSARSRPQAPFRPYGTRPYGTRPYGTRPYGTRPYCASPRAEGAAEGLPTVRPDQEIRR